MFSKLKNLFCNKEKTKESIGIIGIHREEPPTPESSKIKYEVVTVIKLLKKINAEKDA